MNRSKTKVLNSPATRKIFFTLLIVVLTTTVLAFTVNLKLPYEQDQGTKAAKILYLTKTNNISHPQSGPAHYRDWMFSVYYILMSALYALFGGGSNIFGFMNVASVLMGVVFFVSICYALRRTYGIRYIESWIIFISMPVIIIIFTYGNEVAFSFAFFAVAMAVLCSPLPYRSVIAAACMAASMFCRSDMLFLTPFILVWAALYGGPDLSWKRILERVTTIALLIGLFCVVHWLLFLRSLPVIKPLDYYKYNTNIKLFIANLVYPFCPTIVLLGLGSVIFYLVKRRKGIFIVLLLSIPLVYYFKALASPKYIISFALFYGIPASIALNQMKRPFKLCAIVGIGLWWVVSISPYGVRGPEQGSLFFLPTADGRFPTGSYLTFYDRVRRGWYQERYLAEYLGAKNAVQYITTSNNKARLYGFFNGHFLILALIEEGSYDWSEKTWPWDSDSLPIGPTTQILMISRSYLRSDAIDKQQWEKVSKWLKNGQVRPICDKDSPFPLVIEIGDTVAPGTDRDLGNRILFLDTYCKGNGAIKTSYYSSMFFTTSWLRKKDAVGLKELPIYTDNEYYCFSSYVPGGTLWRMPMPHMYYRERDPDARPTQSAIR
jgi:hypothetical protein